MVLSLQIGHFFLTLKRPQSYHLWERSLFQSLKWLFLQHFASYPPHFYCLVVFFALSPSHKTFTFKLFWHCFDWNDHTYDNNLNNPSISTTLCAKELPLFELPCGHTLISIFFPSQPFLATNVFIAETLPSSMLLLPHCQSRHPLLQWQWCTRPRHHGQVLQEGGRYNWQ